MRLTKRVLLLLVAAVASTSSAQSSDTDAGNPFRKFFGQWTLKDDDWNQNWGNGDEAVKIPNHFTTSKPVNTANSVLSVVDTPPKGHIFWTWNPVRKEVRHLSSFGDIRIGVGQGTMNEKGDLRLKVSFEGEAPGTYRIYTYVWITDDEYELKSIQYNAQDKPTGLHYGGRFVRMR